MGGITLPQSLAQILVHAVFSTRNREPPSTIGCIMPPIQGLEK
jgi:hypothetical protein